MIDLGEHTDKYKLLINKRAGYKGRITTSLNLLNESDLTQLARPLFIRRRDAILDYLAKIKDIDEKIVELFELVGLGEDNEESSKEISSQIQYSFQVTDKLDIMLIEIDKLIKDQEKEELNNSIKQQEISNSTINVKMPKLQCKTFTGTSLDKLEYKNFFLQFSNCVDSCKNITKSCKLTYLRSYLSDYAFKVISHLSISDENYDIAVKLLNEEFLDKEYIIDETFSQLLSKSPAFDSSYNESRLYINECRSLLHELKTYQVDLLENKSSGCKLVSHIIFSKLPSPIRRELVHRVKNNYPTINDLFENYNEIIKCILRTSNKPRVNNNKIENSASKTKDVQNVKTEESKSTLQNFKTTTSAKVDNQNKNKEEIVKFCKFCNVNGHSMVFCQKYKTLDSRINRCKELKLCQNCSSGKHNLDECPGKNDNLTYPCFFCKNKSHISAFCNKNRIFEVKTETNTNLCINVNSTGNNTNLLPVLDMKFSRGGNTKTVRCLLDDCSQRSYVKEDILQQLGCNTNAWETITFQVKTFLGSIDKDFKQCAIDVFVPGVRTLSLPFLVDNNLDIKLNVSNLQLALENIKNNGFNLAVPSLGELSEINISALIGVDILQHFHKLEKIKCMHGSAWSTDVGIIPIGNVENFLQSHQITPVSYENSVSNNVVVENSLYSTYINFVLEPKHTYFDPLQNSFPESSVERGLEKMFSLESVGCSENKVESSDYDNAKIDEFKKGITFQDNKYNVGLVWNECIENVQSNSEIAIAILNNVVSKLQKKNLLSAYQDVFNKHLEDGIIEKITVDPKEYCNHVWIPHRPIIRTHDNVTTKIRPVFNCSLKVNDSPSINESAYAGVNLMTDLTKLLLYFRSNKFVMISDIKQAFLQIFLKNDFDKNRFSFFMYENNQLITYRYKTIIFGLNASPFILNYVIKHHVTQYPQDKCSELLNSKFYVDNLLITSNSIDELNDLYKLSYDRMKEGGFTLRSWNTNSEHLRDLFKKDGNFVEHSNNYEKVLGYHFLVEEDKFKLSDNSIEEIADTKRSILSNISKIFDPLGYFLPITARGKTLIQKLWNEKYEWDDEISQEIKLEWKNLYDDLVKLFELKFERNCVNENEDNTLVVFCDASQKLYGFAIYNVSDGNSKLMFSKSKVAPIQKRTLPNLELMSVYLALKVLPVVLNSYSDIKFSSIYVCSDSQIVLSWILSKVIKIKNVFTQNRIKDIQLFKNNVERDFKININFKYVVSEDNPADLVTRGLSFEDFHSQIKFWNEGPSWLSEIQIAWPNSNLGSLSETNKNIINEVSCNLVQNEDHKIPVLFDIRKFSNLSKLFGVTKVIYSFMKFANPMEKSKIYWFKFMQAESFAVELEYLRSIKDQKTLKTIPPLVRDLDLFLDEKGILRSRGRIGKTTYYDFDIINPILLAKNHYLTRLIVEFYHLKVKHLGLQTTLNEVRLAGYWIPRMRQSIKNVINECLVCRKINSLAFKYPKINNLPKHRVNLVKPFNHTGIDYTGHLFVKDSKTDSNEKQKFYILIFTCLNIRAIHIELVSDMTVKQFVLAFQRFINLYGIPSTIYSDNARTFSAGMKYLEEFLVSQEFSNKFSLYNIRHIRIPVYAAWVGATWERMIKTVKFCLYKTVGRTLISYFELLTIISDIQSAINSRPLTYRCSDDNLDIITPNYFLKFNSNPSVMISNHDELNLWDEKPISQNDIVESLIIKQETFEEFREKWYNQYLLNLRETFSEIYEENWENRVKVNDIVLVKLPNRPRPYWVLGRILKLIYGHDNKIRTVQLKRGDGQICFHVIKHLYPLELSLTHNSGFSGNNSETENVEDHESGVDPVVLDGDINQENLGQLGTDDFDSCSDVDFDEINQGEGLVPSDQVAVDISDNSSRRKRKTAVNCRKRIREWAQILND